MDLTGVLQRRLFEKQDFEKNQQGLSGVANAVLQTPPGRPRGMINISQPAHPDMTCPFLFSFAVSAKSPCAPFRLLTSTSSAVRIGSWI